LTEENKSGNATPLKMEKQTSKFEDSKIKKEKKPIDASVLKNLEASKPADPEKETRMK